MEVTGPRMFFRQAVSLICVLLLLPGSALLTAQEAPPPPQAQGPVPATAPLLSPEQLDNLVAPVALYPDSLLSQLLVAATYPLEVVEASQWLQQNRNLQGDQLIDAARQQNWDASVQALVAFPDALNLLSSDIRWTTDLGNAFLAQQADVMNAVQRMRARASASGKLYSNAQETVTTQSEGGQSVVDIQPANPQVVYVPEYNPEYIWGPPAWGYYPPLLYPDIGFGIGFGAGIFIGSFFGGLGWADWGWFPNWFGCSIFQNRFFFDHCGFRGFRDGGFEHGGIWAHNPEHRWGVPYPNRAVASRFAGGSIGRGRFGGGQLGVSRLGGQAYAGSRGGALGRMNSGAGIANRGYSGGGYQRYTPQQRAQISGTNQAGGWRHFGGPATGGTRNPGSSVARSGSAYRSNPSYRGSYGGYTAPSYRNGYRPSPSYRGSYGGGYTAPSYRPGPSYGGFGGYHASGGFGGGRSMPSYRSSPSFGGFGGYHSSGGFGGGRSMPSYRSSPSFGGSHGGGGGFHGGGGGFHASSGSHGGGGGFHGGGGGSHGGGGFHGGGGSHGGRR
jgi:hypothetical protein